MKASNSHKYNLKDKEDNYLKNQAQFKMNQFVNRNRLFYCAHMNRNNQFFKGHILNEKKPVDDIVKKISDEHFGFMRIRRSL